MVDKEIIQGFLNGSADEYNIIVKWISDVVKVRLWVDGDYSGDIVSETALKLLLNFRSNRFKFESSLKTYVQRIARYTVIDYVRSSRQAKEFQKAMHSVGAQGQDPYATYETEEQLILFNTIMGRMNEECRTLWKMIFFDRFHYKAIARELQISEGTVKTKVFRCKEQAISVRKQIS